jgi:signal transduction histidine kinase
VRIPGHKGLGLSLPIAASIAELGGGSLSIDDSGHQWQSDEELSRDEPMVFTLHLPAPEARRKLSLRER